MKRLVNTVVILGMLVAIAGCSSEEPVDLMKEKKETVVNMYNDLLQSYNSLTVEYNELNSKLSNVYADKQLNPGVTSVGDGSGNLTTHSVNEKIEFNSPLTYPNSSSVEASSSINITDNVSVIARDNWTTKLYNSTVELEHSSGISGNISVERINEYISGGNMKDLILTPWIEETTKEPVEYNNIFINNTVLGYQGRTQILIDETNKSTMTCGIAGNNNIAVSYVFVYDGDSDSVKNELIKGIVESVSIADVKLKLE